MIRVIPSHIVSVIEQLFPDVSNQSGFHLTSDHEEAVLALLTLIDQLPDELLPSTPSEYNALMIGRAALRNAPSRWAVNHQEPVVSTPGGYKMNPVQLLYKTLQQCPNEAPSPTTAELLFIQDHALREALRLDMSTACQALANGEWKAATVLAGSVVEALLLWGLQQHPEADYQKALDAVVSKKTVSRPRYASLEEWDFVHYIAVAEELQQINADTATQARLAKDFRNLIHPGRAQRLAQASTRGTTHAAMAAVYMVVECFTP
jgi:hypothetical protein